MLRAMSTSPPTARVAAHYAFVVAAFDTPEGWSLAVNDAERIVYRNEPHTLQATITKLDFAARPSFEEFEQTCHQRLEAERHVLTDGFVQPAGTSPTPKGFIAMYMGGDRTSGRLFSGCLLLVDATLFTIYVEGAGAEPQQLGDAFKAIVSACRGAIRPQPAPQPG
jgi:hypothetical protein